MGEPNADSVTFSRCRQCDGVIGWIDCPTGGWWAHEVHAADEHDASTNYPIKKCWMCRVTVAGVCDGSCEWEDVEADSSEDDK